MAAGDHMHGHRVQGDDKYGDGHLWFPIDEPGAYWHDEHGIWSGITPNGLLGSLANHDVVEYEDGSITVSPSILVTQGRDGPTWHGYLERGVWREV